jgi:hypothetical protein
VAGHAPGGVAALDSCGWRRAAGPPKQAVDVRNYAALISATALPVDRYNRSMICRRSIGSHAVRRSGDVDQVPSMSKK